MIIRIMGLLLLGCSAAYAAEPEPPQSPPPPPAPRPITITATSQEIQQLAAMLEQYGRACAAFLPMQNCATVPLQWEQKLQAAADEASRQPPSNGH
jgi:hypothetical protein